MIKGDLAGSVVSLKRQHRGNLISFGCGELAYELAAQGLADEIHFSVNPVVWGSGDRAFHGRQVRMQLIATTARAAGRWPPAEGRKAIASAVVDPLADRQPSTRGKAGDDQDGSIAGRRPQARGSPAAPPTRPRSLTSGAAIPVTA